MNSLALLNTVMVIDDEEIDQMLYKHILNRSGIVQNVISFLSAEEALEYLIRNKDDKIDAIFLDINMPCMTGFQFLEAATEELGTKFVAMVVVMLTTSLNPKDRAKADDFEVVKDYINKPLTNDDIHRVARLTNES